MYNSFSLKTFLEFYAVIPLVLIALAGTYKFGYFLALDALWILPSVSAYSLFYSILTTTLLFTLGSVISLIYLSFSTWFGHLYSSIFSVVVMILFTFFVGLENIIEFSSKLVPLYFGFFYFFYVHNSIFGNEMEQSLTSPLVLFLGVMSFGFMLGGGVNDAKKAIENNVLPIVIFEQQTSYPNDQTDWRLLETIDTRYVLINLKKRTDYGYEMKVVEYSKIDSIY